MILAMFEGLPHWATMLISQLLAFAILAAVLIKYVIPALRRILADRTRGIQDRFDTLAREVKETSELLAAVRAKLADVEAEAKRRMQAAIEEGARARERALAEARAQAEVELAKARRNIEIERDKAVLELRAELARITLEVTERAVDALMDEKIHGRIVEGYLGGLDRAAGGK
ncbi:MAG TPA: ATP synthase F0 subunit B [Planctomycetota bacterium]